MTDEVCRKATRKAIAIAEEAGILMSYDPNLREPLWKSMDLAKEQISYGLEHCNILKISDNEIQWLTGKEDYDEGIAMVQEKYNIPLILLSLGKTGSRAYTKTAAWKYLPSSRSIPLRQQEPATPSAHASFTTCWSTAGKNTARQSLPRCSPSPTPQPPS